MKKVAFPICAAPLIVALLGLSGAHATTVIEIAREWPKAEAVAAIPALYCHRVSTINCGGQETECAPPRKTPWFHYELDLRKQQVRFSVDGPSTTGPAMMRSAQISPLGNGRITFDLEKYPLTVDIARLGSSGEEFTFIVTLDKKDSGLEILMGSCERQPR